MSKVTAPARFDADLSHLPKLDRQQAGHLRHFHNLVNQPDGEWRHMGTPDPGQEWLDGYRYQLATMAYAAGTTHYHRLPAARSLFAPLLRALVQRMLRRDVWGYWFTTSLGGIATNPDFSEYRVPWSDPVVRENIMYSGHLLLMTSLYAMLLDDDVFEQPGALTFRWNPIFWGKGPEAFVYDNRSLQKAVLAEMEKNGWVGVCCEPNAVFVVCNQFPIIAMRYNDSRDGTQVASEVLEKYKEAWARKNMVGPGGLYPDMWLVEQDRLLQARDVGFTAWANTFMNTWNSDLVKSLYADQALGILTTINGTIRYNQPPVALAFRALVLNDNADPNSATTLTRAQEIAAATPTSAFPYTKPTFGYVAQWLSELGREPELAAVLAHADARMGPAWEDGGFFYRRRDAPLVDADGEWAFVSAYEGNAALAFARLNVPDGQRAMWESPWTREELAGRVWVDGLGLAAGVDCVRAVWDDRSRALVVTLRSWHGKPVGVTPTGMNLGTGLWAVYVSGELVKTEEVVAPGRVAAGVTVAGEDVDVVFQKLS